MEKVTWQGLPRKIDKATSKIVESQTKVLYSDIVRAWPVKSGKSKAGWRVRDYVSGHYAVVNFVRSPEGYNYVADLWIGLPVGSDQLPNGGDPILARNIIQLRSRLGGMKI